jgi:hypothetical protein
MVNTFLFLENITYLILVSLLFIYEGVFNFFFQSAQESYILQFQQFALLQLLFLIGILFKTLDPENY